MRTERMGEGEFEAWGQEIGLTDAQYLPVRFVVDREYDRGVVSRGAVEQISALEGALREAVAIVGGGRRPESAMNRKAREWQDLLRGDHAPADGGGSAGRRERDPSR